MIPGTTVNPLCEYVEELEAKRQRNKEKVAIGWFSEAGLHE